MLRYSQFPVFSFPPPSPLGSPVIYLTSTEYLLFPLDVLFSATGACVCAEFDAWDLWLGCKPWQVLGCSTDLAGRVQG